MPPLFFYFNTILFKDKRIKDSMFNLNQNEHNEIRSDKNAIYK